MTDWIRAGNYLVQPSGEGCKFICMAYEPIRFSPKPRISEAERIKLECDTYFKPEIVKLLDRAEYQMLEKPLERVESYLMDLFGAGNLIGRSGELYRAHYGSRRTRDLEIENRMRTLLTVYCRLRDDIREVFAQSHSSGS
ncbi:hypothetical protein [Leptolyngbya ohadii]|uniref:hypothetical protein n=1 Tax=Leptolyngbya ohadii TaxID=1962290 RepID=UPI00117A2328|nr:hypothetical protein [Leptolyngbya ohadii]